jgi:hypothetical protein
MATLFEQLTAARCKTDHYESTLYVESSETSIAIVRKSGLPYSFFVDNIDKTLWIDVPFAYTPFWEAAVLAGAGL